jgi:predicted ATPase
MADAIDATADSVALARNVRTAIDAARFTDAARTGTLALGDVEAYAEPAFPGSDDEWLEAARRRLRDAQREALARSFETALSHGDPAAIERSATAVVKLDALDEVVVRRAMNALAALGELGRAERLYAALEQHLRVEYEAEPAAETAALLRSLQARVTPAALLPSELTPFHGRERELQAVLRACAAARIVTVTGAIGVGKSRLARQAARELASAHAGGAQYLNVAAHERPDAARAALADLLRATGADDASLAGAIRALDVLLVLDGCDALRDTFGPLVETLLRASSRSSVIASARAPLGAAGEHIVVLEPLGLPPAFADAKTLAAAPAVDFFLERARHTGACDLESRDALAAVGEICRDLDGLPGALESAAQRLSAIGLTALRGLARDHSAPASLGDAFLAAYARSYDALDSEARTVFRRFALIRGAWSAERVASACGLPAGATAAALARLSECSLVERDAAGRYSVLRSTRDYTLCRLVEAGEREEAEHSYVRTMLEPLVVRNAELRGARSFEAFDAVERDLEDVRAALDLAIVERRAPELGVRALFALSRFHFDRGRVVEALRWYDAALAQPLTPRALYAEAIYLQAVLSRSHVGFAESLARFEAALDVLRTDGEAETTAKALLFSANAARMTGDVPKALAYATEARDAFSERGNVYFVGTAETALGVAHYTAGDLERARAAFTAGVEHFREFGARADEALALASVGRCFFGSGEFARAEASFRSALALAEKVGYRYAEAHAHLSLALLALDRGERSEVRPHLIRAAMLALEAADVELSIVAVEAVAEDLLANEFFERAVAALAAGDAARRRTGSMRAPTERTRYRAARARLAELALALVDPEPAPALEAVLVEYTRAAQAALPA